MSYIGTRLRRAVDNFTPLVLKLASHAIASPVYVLHHVYQLLLVIIVNGPILSLHH